MLGKLLHGGSHILLCDYVAADGPRVFDHACKLGVVSKRLDAPYRSGPTWTWIKCKNPAAIEAQRGRVENWHK